MNDKITVATIQKNSKDEIRVDLQQYHGNWIFNARVWYLDKDGVRKPSKQGIAFQIGHLPDFTDAVTKALEIAQNGSSDE